MGHMFEIKEGDLLPELTGNAVSKVTGDPLDLAGAGVRFLMRASGAASPLISATAAAPIVNASQGELAYVWQAGDTATRGFYEGEFELIFPSTKPQTVPGRGYIGIVIDEDIG